MKKLILFISALTLNLSAFAQALPNGTFENWSSTLFVNPTGWNTGNTRDIQKMGMTSVTQVTGFSGFAVRIETIITSSDTSESYILNIPNPCSEPPNWTGGYPFTQQATAITGYYRYNLPGNDTAILIVMFRKNNAMVSFDVIPIHGTGSQPTWTSFSFPLTLSVVPDSVIIAAASWNKITYASATNGGFLELDNLGFAGATQIIPNGDFENWASASYDVPSGWDTEGNVFPISATAYADVFSIALETAGDECGGVREGWITTGHSTDQGPTGGRPYNLMNDTLCGYYRYNPAGSDSGAIFVQFTNSTVQVGGNMLDLPAASVWTYFELPLSAFSLPDTIRIDAYSSKWPSDSTNSGSILYLDNLQLKSDPLGVVSFSPGGNNVSFVFPNPVHDILNVRLAQNYSGSVRCAVYDVTGRMLMQEILSSSAPAHCMNVSQLSGGVYVYELIGTNYRERGRFVKE